MSNESRLKSNVAVAGQKDVVLLPVADLIVRYDVRKNFNEDRIILLAELYQSGAEVPPIEVVRGTMEIHDGRHRKSALELLGRKHAQCILVEQMEFFDQLTDAFGKNMSDSPFPPMRIDVIYVMKQLLEAGASNADIQKKFEQYYKPSHVKTFLKDAHGAVGKANMAKAKHAVAHLGATLADAAKDHKVKVDQLRAEIIGVKKVGLKSDDISDIKANITNRNRGNTNKNVAIIRRTFERFEDGELSEKNVLEIRLNFRLVIIKIVKRARKINFISLPLV